MFAVGVCWRKCQKSQTGRFEISISAAATVHHLLCLLIRREGGGVQMWVYFLFHQGLIDGEAAIGDQVRVIHQQPDLR